MCRFIFILTFFESYFCFKRWGEGKLLGKGQAENSNMQKHTPSGTSLSSARLCVFTYCQKRDARV